MLAKLLVGVREVHRLGVYAADKCDSAYGMLHRRTFNRQIKHALGVGLGSVIKKRRKKMRKHKHKKMLKKTRWARRAHA